MSLQLSIFDTGLFCSCCLQDPGFAKGIHWPGFFDADTRQFICWPCRNTHYKNKALNGQPGLYSEMPVTLPVPLVYKS